ncbi:MAG: type I DNA topoisomerase [Deltaproteobacteria bacterium]|jgi:DNA topoisomerase-1|nr:type I DNA topoisomerase [Deltaproteobacteria bacterium]
MADKLLIVESPAKAKTIGKYLGDDFQVVASVGHIRDLPPKRLGVDILNDFSPEYVAIDGKEKIINSMKKAARGKKDIFLAPDPDREGEAIAWHIAQSLGVNNHNFQRVLFHELTPQAVKAAIAKPVPLSQTRFESQQTRRILDRLMGYLISPLLWDKLKRGLSAGRVQSVALRLVVERERLIYAFTPEEYWTVTAFFLKDETPFEAALFKKAGQKAVLNDEAAAAAVVEAVSAGDFTVAELAAKERRRSPLPPFTTSTLQQNAFNRLHLDPGRTMRVAQNLYEGVELPEGQVGLITYMRTDSVRVSNQASVEAMSYARAEFGPDYAPATPNSYRNKKGAQDAHEAIRPTSSLRTPDQLKNHLDHQHWQLYNLIWRRFVASQMSSALLMQTTADLTAADCVFRATGSVVTFKGFLAVYDPGLDDDKKILPRLEQGERLKPSKIEPKQHFTQPPARFNEATLVKELEDKGIGRPSTYAAIISVLRDKEYVHGQKGQLRPTEMGFMVTDLLTASFPRLMDVTFTAGLEEDLDQIEEGSVDHLEVLKKLYEPLAAGLASASQGMRNVKVEGYPVDLPCPKCGQSGAMFIRYGRNGFYLSCRCGCTSDYERDERGQPQPLTPPELESEVLCDKCGRPMVPKRGRYGTFLACSGYPDCRNAKRLKTSENGRVSLDEETPPPLPEGLDPNCPKCGSPMIARKTRLGTWFIACSGYPKCRHAASFPTGFACPAPGCPGVIVERPSKRGSVFFGCSDYPRCRVILRGKPVKEPCPVCAFPYQVESQAKGSDFGQLFCPNDECPTQGGEKSRAVGGGRSYDERPARNAGPPAKAPFRKAGGSLSGTPTAAKAARKPGKASAGTPTARKTAAGRRAPAETPAHCPDEAPPKRRQKSAAVQLAKTPVEAPAGTAGPCPDETPPRPRKKGASGKLAEALQKSAQQLAEADSALANAKPSQPAAKTES